jgi:hypothetical protein
VFLVQSAGAIEVLSRLQKIGPLYYGPFFDRIGSATKTGFAVFGHDKDWVLNNKYKAA